MEHEIESLQDGIVDFCKNIHTARFFPVVPHFRVKLFFRLKELCVELSWTISATLCNFLLGEHVEDSTSLMMLRNDDAFDYVQTEYLFKTYEILRGNVYLDVLKYSTSTIH